MRTQAFALVLVAQACAPATALKGGPTAPTPEMQPDPASVFAFAAVEDEVWGWLAAADPRLAIRAGVTAPDKVLEKLGTEAVLAEDVAAQVRNGSLDLFAFQGRARALRHASERLSAFRDPLPETGPAGGPLERPRLERDLLARTIEEELARAVDEASLGDSAGDLVRGIVTTWTPPKEPREVPDRDAWASKHVLEIGASLQSSGARTGPMDLDAALYPLERLLQPLVFPKASAAIARVRVSIDADMRPNPPLVAPDRIAHAVRVHLGMAVEMASLKGRLEAIDARLADVAKRTLEEAGDSRGAIESRARELLFVEKRCPQVSGSRVRNVAPPPERAPICGVVAAFTEEPSAAAIVALHDDVQLALAAVTTAPPPRTGLLSHPDDDVVDSLRKMARERPVVALGVALAAELLYSGDHPADRARAWRDLGDAPLDVVAENLSH